MSTVAAAASTDRSHPTTEAPSPANIRAVARPMPPPEPVMTQTFPTTRPGISVHAPGCGGRLLGVRNPHLDRALRELVEVPGDDPASRSREWRRPLPEQ